MRNTNVLILTDDAEFAKLLTACWQVERQLPGICVVTSEFWKDADTSSQDLIVIGPLKDGKLSDVLRSMGPNTALILCAPSEASELGLLRKKYPKLLHVPLREDWTQMVLLLAGESLRVKGGVESTVCVERINVAARVCRRGRAAHPE